MNIFLLDSFLAKEARSYLSLLLLSSSIKFRIGLPQLNVLSKVDLLSQQELESVMSWGEGDELINALGTLDDSSYELASSVVQYASTSPIPVSATTGMGMDSLYAHIQRILAGGEDYYTEEPNPNL